MTHRHTLAAAAACAAMAAVAPAAHAVTNGTPDDGRHPYVGALVSYDPATGDKYLICSGTLVAPAVFLTAAHCLQDEPSDLYVSFDEVVGAPDVGPGVTLHHGQARGNPRFAGDTDGPGDTHDLAVVVLDAPVPGVTPARLAARNQLKKVRKRAGRLQWTVAGYGREGHDGEGFFGGGSKRSGLGAWGALQRGTFTLSQDAPSEAGTCNGDSGGPVLLGDTVVGVSSDGDATCARNGIYTRLDTQSAQAFVRPLLRAKPVKPVKPDKGGPKKP